MGCFLPGSLSGQSAEAVRRVREAVTKAGGKLAADNVYGLELTNGSRGWRFPGSDDFIRGLTVDAWIVADEAARLSNDLIAALRPMRARHPEARFAMLSTAWSRTDPFWMAWDSDDPSWIRLKATADTVRYDPESSSSVRSSDSGPSDLIAIRCSWRWKISRPRSRHETWKRKSTKTAKPTSRRFNARSGAPTAAHCRRIFPTFISRLSPRPLPVLPGAMHVIGEENSQRLDRNS